MALGTIVVHLANDARHRDRLAFAMDLARQHGAHLVALYVTAPVHMPAAVTGRAASFAFLAEASAIALQKAQALEAETAQLCAAGGLSWEWRTEEEKEHEEAIHHYALLADLLIVGQSESVQDNHLITVERPEQAALKAGCPVLVLPAQGAYAPARRVLVAWKDSPEANRALRESLGVLARAEKVFVLGVDDPETAQAPGRSVVAYLKRHRIDAELRSDFGRDSEAGATILAQARALDCDLVVMGAWGQSRLANLLFGSTTNYMLDHTDRALLMAH
jgi:nucleotide-binding universal stress UspA family protein